MTIFCHEDFRFTSVSNKSEYIKKVYAVKYSLKFYHLIFGVALYLQTFAQLLLMIFT